MGLRGLYKIYNKLNPLSPQKYEGKRESPREEQQKSTSSPPGVTDRKYCMCHTVYTEQTESVVQYERLRAALIDKTTTTVLASLFWF